MDEGFGIQTSDASGANNHGTLVNNPLWVAGVNGTALEFNSGATNTRVDVPDAGSLDITGEFTAMAWILNQGQTTSGRVLDKYRPGPSDNSAYALYVFTDDSLSVFIPGGGLPASTLAKVPRNQWVHVAATYNGLRVRLYINGILKDSYLTNVAVPATDGSFGVGNRQDNLRPFKGVIDEVKLFNRALTSDEVLAHYEGCPVAAEVRFNYSFPLIFASADVPTQLSLKVVIPAPADGTVTIDSSDDGVAGDSAVSFSLAGPTCQPVSINVIGPGNADLTPSNDMGFGNGPARPIRVIPSQALDLQFPSPVIVVGNSQQSRLIGNFGEAGTRDVTNHPATTYESSNPDVAIITGTGLITGTGGGNATITAHHESLMAGAQITVLSDPLVLYLPFNEGSGTQTLDLSGLGNHGNFVNNPKWVPGKFGAGLEFSAGGVNNRVDVPDSNSLDVANALTMMAWVFNKGQTERGRIVDKNSSYALYIYTDDSLSVYFLPSSIPNVTNAKVPRNEWAHVAATYNGAQAKLYVNGVLKDTKSEPVSITPNASPLTVGNRQDNLRPFTGVIDELKVFRRVLTPEEIYELSQDCGNVSAVSFLPAEPVILTDMDIPKQLTARIGLPMPGSGTVNVSSSDGAVAGGASAVFTAAGSMCKSVTIDVIGPGSANLSLSNDMGFANGPAWQIDVVSLQALRLDLPSSFLAAGATMRATLTGDYGIAGNRDLTRHPGTIYETSDSRVALVNAEGLITAVGKGIATIQARRGSQSASKTLSVVETSLVLFLPFNEGNGSQTLDVSGFENHGSLLNDPPWVPGKFGFALEFGAGGSPSQVMVPDSGSLKLQAEATFMAWVHHPGQLAEGRILDKNSSYGLFIGPDDSLGIAFDPFLHILTTDAKVPRDEWAHVTATYDGSEVKFYLNGELKDTRIASGALAGSSDPVMVGSSLAGAFPFIGKLDELKIFKGALPREELIKAAGLCASLMEVSHASLAPFILASADVPATITLETAVPSPSHGIVTIDSSDESVAGDLPFEVFPFSSPCLEVDLNVTGIGTTNLSLSNTMGLANGPPRQLSVIPIQSLELTGPPFLTIGQSGQLQAEGDFGLAGIRELTRHPRIVYTSTQPEIATVDAQGQVTATSAGLVTIIAKFGGIEGARGITVFPSLVLYLPLDEGSGTDAHDASGLQNHGILKNQPLWTMGKSGWALEFSAGGGDPSVEIGASSSLDLSARITLMAWVFNQGQPSSGPILDKSSYALLIAGDDGLQVKFPPALDLHSSAARVPRNEWTHVAATFDGSQVKFYLNGELKDTQAAAGPIVPSDSPLRLGASPQGSQNTFTGRLDEVKLFNQALSAVEILAAMVPPGVVSGLQHPGDFNQDGNMDISDAVNLLGFLFLGSPNRMPCEDGKSTDAANLMMFDFDGSGQTDITDGVNELYFLFLGGSPHVQGKKCIPVPACPDLPEGVECQSL
ncbi:MAG: Ig-like domain-containing protein [Planctomycetes bacterium]|nr:Ig-like domain-containing protein [Planctomycetota bacterium]